MPRRRRPEEPVDERDAAYREKLRRRLEYLVTNRHLVHEASVLVSLALKNGWFLTRDTRRLATEVKGWLAEKEIGWDDDGIGPREAAVAIRTLRPAMAAAEEAEARRAAAWPHR